jgi:hypothetical protein
MDSSSPRARAKCVVSISPAHLLYSTAVVPTHTRVCLWNIRWLCACTCACARELCRVLGGCAAGPQQQCGAGARAGAGAGGVSSSSDRRRRRGGGLVGAGRSLRRHSEAWREPQGRRQPHGQPARGGPVEAVEEGAAALLLHGHAPPPDRQLRCLRPRRLRAGWRRCDDGLIPTDHPATFIAGGGGVVRGVSERPCAVS